MRKPMQQPIAFIHLSDMSFAQSISGKYGWRIEPSVKRSNMQHIEQGKGKSKAAIVAPSIQITKVFRPLHIKLITNHYVLNQVVQYKQSPLLSEPIKQQYEERVEQLKWQKPTDGIMKKVSLLIQEQEENLQQQRLQVLLSSKTIVSVEDDIASTQSRSLSIETAATAKRVEHRPNTLTLQLLKKSPQQHSKQPQAKAIMKLSSYIRSIEASEAKQQADARRKASLHINSLETRLLETQLLNTKQLETKLLESKQVSADRVIINHTIEAIHRKLETEVKQQSFARRLVANHVSLHQQSWSLKRNEQQHNLVISNAKKIQLTALIHEKLLQKQSILIKEQRLLLQGKTQIQVQPIEKRMEQQQELTPVKQTGIDKATRKQRLADTIATKLKYYLKASTIHTNLLSSLNHISQTEHQKLIYSSSLPINSQRINEKIKLYYRKKETVVEKSLQHKLMIENHTISQPVTANAYISSIRQELAVQQNAKAIAVLKQKTDAVLQMQTVQHKHSVMVHGSRTIKATKEHIVLVTKLHQQLLEKHEKLIYQREMVEKKETSHSKKMITVPQVKLSFKKQETTLMESHIQSLAKKVSIHSSLHTSRHVLELAKNEKNNIANQNQTQNENSYQNQAQNQNQILKKDQTPYQNVSQINSGQTAPLSYTRKLASLHYSIRSPQLEHTASSVARSKNQRVQKDQATRVKQLEGVIEQAAQAQQAELQTSKQVLQQNIQQTKLISHQQQEHISRHVIHEQLMLKGLYKKMVNEQFEQARLLRTSTLVATPLLQQGQFTNQLPASLKSIRTLNQIQRIQLQFIHQKTKELNTLPILMNLSRQPHTEQPQQANDRLLIEKLVQRNTSSLIYKESNQLKLVSSIVKELKATSRVTSQINQARQQAKLQQDKIQQAKIQQAVAAASIQSPLTLGSNLTVAKNITTRQLQFIKTAQQIQLHKVMTYRNSLISKSPDNVGVNAVRQLQPVASTMQTQQSGQQSIALSPLQRTTTGQPVASTMQTQQLGQRSIALSPLQRTTTGQPVASNRDSQQAGQRSIALHFPQQIATQQKQSQQMAASRDAHAPLTATPSLSMIHSVFKKSSIHVKNIVEQARPVALHVAQKAQQQKSESPPAVVTQLEQSVRRLEQELQDTKENIKAPKWNIGQLTDQLYNQLSKKIRLEQHRNGR